MSLKFTKITESVKLSERHFCNVCQSETIHESHAAINTVHEAEDVYSPYAFVDYHIIQCGGCHDLSFMIVNRCSVVTEGYGDDERMVPEVQYFPEHLPFNREISLARSLPSSIFELYKETITLISKKMYRFAALGLRLLIEAVAKDNGAAKYNLGSKIQELRAANIITEEEKEVLEILKDYGDGAAHRDETQPESILQLSLKIMESVITRLYVFTELRKELLDSQNQSCGPV